MFFNRVLETIENLHQVILALVTYLENPERPEKTHDLVLDIE